MFYEVIPGRGTGRLETALTYNFSDSLPVGAIVEVPLGRIRVPGIVVKKVAQPNFPTKSITRILYSKPLPSHLIKTAVWLSEYYQAPLSGAMGMMLPVGVLKKRRNTGVKTAKTEQTEQIIHVVRTEVILQFLGFLAAERINAETYGINEIPVVLNMIPPIRYATNIQRMSLA